jgi:predicted phage terminase large subunit-like protein
VPEKKVLTAELIEGLVNGLLKKNFDSPAAIPECHREWWRMCCSSRKFVAIAAPRGHAKSTAITHSYVVASILFRERSFILVVSDTESQAVFFVEDIKKEFLDNEDLIRLFGVKGLVKDSQSDVIIEFEDGHQCRIMAKGSGQSLRGCKWDHRRPDLVVGDDLENDEIVMNKERREKFRHWFTGALIPILSKNGAIRLVGTILHADAQLERLMPKIGDKGVIPGRLHYKSDPRKIWLSAKYQAHDAAMTEALWPEFKSIEWLKRERETFKEQGMLDVWSQEMLNIPLDESTAPFQRRDFIPMDDQDYERRKLYYIGTDFAPGAKQRGDYSVFVVGGVDENSTLHIVHVVKERMDVKEAEDVLFELVEKYQPEMVFFEGGMLWNAIEVGIKDRMIKTGAWFSYEALSSTQDKVARSSAIRSRMRAGGVRFNKRASWYDDYEAELLGFPRLAHDDQVDGTTILGRGLLRFREAPTDRELSEEAYEDEKIQGGFYEQGREELTGY